jgi:hypothetical protein
MIILPEESDETERWDLIGYQNSLNAKRISADPRPSWIREIYGHFLILLYY